MITLAPNPSWLEGVTYDAIARVHAIDSRPVPSVTQAIDVAYPDRFAGVSRPVLARAAAIGTAVHAAVHYLAQSDLNESTVALEARPRLEAWKWFTATRRVVPILTEAVVASRDRGLPVGRRWPYVGRLDFLCTVDGHRVVLLDLKTGAAGLAGMQTIAYLDALYQQYPALIAISIERWAVRLTAAGRYHVHVYRDERGDARDWRDALVRAYRAPGAAWEMR